MARRPTGELRIVFDLSRSIRAKSFLTPPNDRYGYRLVIDLGSTASADTPVKVQHARPNARDLIIAIDAGHGGEDPGAIGKNGTREKDVVLAIARALAQRVDAEPGMKAFLTRNGDYFLPLRNRMRRARAQQADLFVSIHADSIRDRSVDGSSVSFCRSAALPTRPRAGSRSARMHPTLSAASRWKTRAMCWHRCCWTCRSPLP